jgi:hypothetical protein
MYEFLKTSHPGGIRTHDLLVLSRARCHLTFRFRLPDYIITWCDVPKKSRIQSYNLCSGSHSGYYYKKLKTIYFQKAPL